MKFEISRLEPVKVVICGNEYPLRLPFRGLAELEELLKENFFKIFDKFTNQEYGKNETEHILYVMLKCGGVELNISDLEDIDFSVDIMNAMTLVLSRSHNVQPLIDESILTEGTQNAKKKTT